GLRRQAPSRSLRGGSQAPPGCARRTARGTSVDDGGELHHCRHGDLPMGECPEHLLWSRRARRHEGLQTGAAGARGVSRTSRDRACAEHSRETQVIKTHPSWCALLTLGLTSITSAAPGPLPPEDDKDLARAIL